MTPVGTYDTSLAAELARLPLELAGIRTMVVGVEAGMQGGTAGIHLLVPFEYQEAARALLAQQDR